MTQNMSFGGDHLCITTQTSFQTQSRQPQTCQNTVEIYQNLSTHVKVHQQHLSKSLNSVKRKTIEERQSMKDSPRQNIYQNLSTSVKICQTLLKICQILSKAVKIYQTLSKAFKICQHLSKSVKSCQNLLNVVKSYQTQSKSICGELQYCN